MNAEPGHHRAESFARLVHAEERSQAISARGNILQDTREAAPCCRMRRLPRGWDERGSGVRHDFRRTHVRGSAYLDDCGVGRCAEGRRCSSSAGGSINASAYGRARGTANAISFSTRSRGTRGSQRTAPAALYHARRDCSEFTEERWIPLLELRCRVSRGLGVPPEHMLDAELTERVIDRAGSTYTAVRRRRWRRWRRWGKPAAIALNRRRRSLHAALPCVRVANRA